MGEKKRVPLCIGGKKKVGKVTGKREKKGMARRWGKSAGLLFREKGSFLFPKVFTEKSVCISGGRRKRKKKGHCRR